MTAILPRNATIAPLKRRRHGSSDAILEAPWADDCVPGASFVCEGDGERPTGRQGDRRAVAAGFRLWNGCQIGDTIVPRQVSIRAPGMGSATRREA